MLSPEFRPHTAQGVCDAGIDKLAASYQWPSFASRHKIFISRMKTVPANPAGVDLNRTGSAGGVGL